MRDIHRSDFLEAVFFEELTDELSFTATKIENPLRTCGFKSGHDCAESLFVQAEALLDLRFFLRLHLLGPIRVRIILVSQPKQSVVDEIMTMLEVAARDHLALRMRGEPGL